MKQFLIPFLVLSAPWAIGEEFYSADFSVSGQGATHDSVGDDLEVSPIMGVNWMIFWDADPAPDTTTNSFITADGVLFSSDWGGEAFFETDAIDVSLLDVLVVRAEGMTLDDPFTAGSEYFEWFYSLDGAAPVSIQRFEQGDEGVLDIEEVIDVSGVSSLVVSFGFDINGVNDGFEIFSLRVDDELSAPVITVGIDPSSVSENGGSAVVSVTLSEAPAADLELTVVIDDASEASADSVVMILSGETSGSVEVTALDDDESDGDQVVTITVSDASGVYQEGAGVLMVTDDEAPVTPVIFISELRVNAPSEVAGNGEYFELFSPEGGVSLDGLWFVTIGDGSASLGSGVIEEVVPLDGFAMNGNYFVVAQTGQEIAVAPDHVRTLSFENDDNITFLLVTDFSGAKGDDLDANDDGALDVQPWGAIVDGVSVVISPNGVDGSAPTSSEWDYSEFLSIQGVGPDGSFAPGHIYRDGENDGAFSIGVFDPDDEAALDSPGAENPGGAITPPVLDPRILSLTIDVSTGEGEMVVTGLGELAFDIEASSNLGQVTSPWTVLASGHTEVENEDGTVTLRFTDGAIPAAGNRFYRINEAP